jgi:ATP-dependent DNA ligase
VATDVRGRLKIVAHVSDGIPAEVHAALREQMKELKRDRPFIPSRQEAVWLQPKLFCRVGFNDYNSSEKMKEPLFREMLLTPSAAE